VLAFWEVGDTYFTADVLAVDVERRVARVVYVMLGVRRPGEVEVPFDLIIPDPEEEFRKRS
jgi:hypothetical protein